MQRIRVLIVDDHQIVRRGLRAILEREPDLEVIGEAASAEAALAIVTRTPPDVALVDIRLEGMGGIELCRRIREVAPGVAVVMLTSFLNETLVRECVQAGARGYLLKDVNDLDLVQSIRRVVQGEAVLAPKAASLLVDWMQQREHGMELTAEDLHLLRLIARGLTNRELAAELYLSESAVKERVLELFRKMKVKGRVEAVMEGVRRGLL
ncbi:MAG: response regulator transcription factor [Firmicutes bacterium]|nr:response regulator transcription factor [Bacillota bacterium]